MSACRRGVEIGLRRRAKGVGQHHAAHRQAQHGPDRRRRDQARRQGNSSLSRLGTQVRIFKGIAQPAHRLDQAGIQSSCAAGR